MPLREQCEKTRDIILSELNRIESSLLRPFVALLDAGFKAAPKALDDRGGAAGKRATTRADINDWKDGVNRPRTATYGDLIKIGAENGYKNGWVEAFFRAEDEAEAEEPASAPAPESS